MKFLLKLIFYIIVFILLLSSVWFLNNKYSFLSSLAFSTSRKIVTTKVMLKGIKNLRQLTTQVYYSEFVKKLAINGKLSLVAVVKGNVYVGINLENIKESNFIINKKTKELTIKMPRIKILDSVINPQGIRLIKQGKQVSFKQLQMFHVSALEDLKKRALASGVLKKAKKQATLTLTVLFEKMGFTTVTLNWPYLEVL